MNSINPILLYNFISRYIFLRYYIMIGFIYSIKNTLNDLTYIGSTIRGIEERFKQHMYYKKVFVNFKLYKAMNEYGVENFYITLLETMTYNAVCELRMREGYYIKLLTPLLNSNIAGRTITQYQKDNKVKLNEYRKHYYRKYRLDNKEKMKKYITRNIN